MTIHTSALALLALSLPLAALPAAPELSGAHFATGLAPTRTLHVDVAAAPDGNGSATRPFQRIQTALAEARPGTAIRIHPGNYAGGVRIEGLAGTAAAPIWIGGLPGEPRPVFSGTRQGIHMSRVRYVVVHDLEVQGMSANGINCDDGGLRDDASATQFVLFERLHIHDIGGTGNQDGLKLSGVDDYAVLDSRFERCGGGTSGSGIDQVGCHAGRIANNHFEDLSGNAIQCKGGSQNIEIRANTFVRPGARGINIGGSTGFDYFRPPLSTTESNVEARDIRVFANVFRGGATAVAFVGSVDCIVANNTIVNPETWAFRILQETTSKGDYDFVSSSRGRFFNNIVWFSREELRSAVNVGGGTAPETFQIANNLWHAHDRPNESRPRLPVEETDGIYGRDPGIRPESYTLPPASPAVGRGLAFESAPELDHAGRKFRKAPSIGALELQ